MIVTKKKAIHRTWVGKHRGFVRIMTKNNSTVLVPKWVFRSTSGLDE